MLALSLSNMCSTIKEPNPYETYNRNGSSATPTKCVVMDGTDLIMQNVNETKFNGNIRENRSKLYVTGVGAQNMINNDNTDTSPEFFNVMGYNGNFLGGSFTIATWVKFDATGSVEPILSWREHVDRGITLSKNASDNLNFRVDATDIVDGSPTDLSADTWYHVTITFNDSTNAAAIYLNGSGTAEASATVDFDGADSVNNSSFVPQWGGDTTNGTTDNRYFLGKIFQFDAWDTVLTAAEIAKLYNGGDPYDARLISTAANNYMTSLVFGDHILDETNKYYFAHDFGGDFFNGNIQLRNVYGYPQYTSNTAIGTDSPSS
tara:strand:+ start:1753 stop:2709 length:957 start_codon:yes stop_codon:yes gene_type:complete